MSANQVSADVFDELRKRYDELTNSQKRIAEVIVEDPEFVAFATVDQLGTKLELNPSTIVRFAYRLGLDGYNDLQNRVRERVRAQLSHRGRASEGETTTPSTAHLEGTVFASSFAHDIAILQRSIAQLSEEELARAVDAIVQARRVFLAGGYASHGIAQYMTLALSRLRADTFLLGTSEEEAALLLQATDQDTLVAFTFPPYASRTVQIVRLLKSQGSKVIAITDSPISPVGQLVDIVLAVLSSGISTQNSHVPALAVANALINAVVAATPTTALDRYRRVMQLMNEGDAFVLKGTES